MDQLETQPWARCPITIALVQEKYIFQLWHTLRPLMCLRRPVILNDHLVPSLYQCNIYLANFEYQEFPSHVEAPVNLYVVSKLLVWTNVSGVS